MEINTVLFIGAHPDDIEIGAACTAAHLRNLGVDVWFMVLTREIDYSAYLLRKKEAVNAANFLSVDAQHLLFADFFDTKLKCERDSVDRIRSMVNYYKINPQIVFTMSPNDSHNDHREAFHLTLSVFREKIILCYSVPLSGFSYFKAYEYERPLSFNGMKYLEIKKNALKCHASQIKKINKMFDNFNAYRELSSESFELILQHPHCKSEVLGALSKQLKIFNSQSIPLKNKELSCYY